MSPVVIYTLKRPANYIAVAPASFCSLGISKHQDTCKLIELIVPEIQEQCRLTPPQRDNDLPSPKQPSALNSQPEEGAFFTLNFGRKVLQR